MDGIRLLPDGVEPRTFVEAFQLFLSSFNIFNYTTPTNIKSSLTFYQKTLFGAEFDTSKGRALKIENLERRLASKKDNRGKKAKKWLV